jgi:hypothetical protein
MNSEIKILYHIHSLWWWRLWRLFIMGTSIVLSNLVVFYFDSNFSSVAHLSPVVIDPDCRQRSWVQPSYPYPTEWNLNDIYNKKYSSLTSCNWILLYVTFEYINRNFQITFRNYFILVLRNHFICIKMNIKIIKWVE